MNNRVCTIYLTVGIPASGKTTWAKEKVRDERRTKRISKDDLRDMFDNGEFSRKNEGIILDLRDEMVESLLLRGYDVVIDDTNFSNQHWKRMTEIAKRVGNVRVVEVFFSIRLNEALKRNQERDKDVPDHIVEGMFKKHVRNKKVEQRDEFFVKAKHPHGENHINKEDMPCSIIVDMDGTLCLNSSGRAYYDYDRVIEDDPNVEVIRAVEALHNEGYVPIILTGREDTGECRKQCEEWLDAFEVPYDKLFMRPKNDYRPDTEVKREIYENEIHDNYNVEFVIDDRMSVTNMWRSLGITTFQVSKGTF